MNIKINKPENSKCKEMYMVLQEEAVHLYRVYNFKDEGVEREIINLPGRTKSQLISNYIETPETFIKEILTLNVTNI